MQVTFANYSDALAYMKTGRLRPLGICSPKRFSQSPEVPTIAEAGIPGYAVKSWNGLFAPAATPPAIVERLAAAIQNLYQDSATRARMHEMGAEPVGDSQAQFRAFVDSEMKKWAKLR